MSTWLSYRRPCKRIVNGRVPEPAQELDHLRFVCMVDDSLAKSTLGFEAEYDLIETLGHLRLTKLLDGN